MSRNKIVPAVDFPEGESLARKIKHLRTSRGLSQTELAAICGVKQPSVNQWERVGCDAAVPSAKNLLKLSELAAEQDRQWWRDQAARRGFDVDAAELSGSSIILPRYFRTIPLLKDARELSTLGTPLASQVERNLHFPEEWFPEGGTVRAVRIRAEGMSDMIAMIDTSRKEADRLVGHLVAISTAAGVEVRWLKRLGQSYILMSFHPELPSKELRLDGEDSIVGVVRWIGDSAAPSQEMSRAS